MEMWSLHPTMPESEQYQSDLGVGSGFRPHTLLMTSRDNNLTHQTLHNRTLIFLRDESTRNMRVFWPRQGIARDSGIAVGWRLRYSNTIVVVDVVNHEWVSRVTPQLSLPFLPPFCFANPSVQRAYRHRRVQSATGSPCERPLCLRQFELLARRPDDLGGRKAADRVLPARGDGPLSPTEKPSSALHPRWRHGGRLRRCRLRRYQ